MTSEGADHPNYHEAAWELCSRELVGQRGGLAFEEVTLG
jgi:hypothetical protein